MPSVSPVMGLSPMQAHQMAQDMVGGQSDDPESQKEKFMAQGGIETLSGASEDVGECDLSAGTPVHGSVMVAINSDLPAQNTVTVRVNKTVYCGADGEHVAIPQGSTFVGSVDQRVQYGQERIQLCMKQLQRPKSTTHPRGDRKQLGCFVVADIQGASGMPADVDNHWGAVIGGSLLSAILSLGTTASMGNQEGFAPTIAQRAANAAGQNLNSAGQRIVQRDLARKPTLTTEQLEDVLILFSSNLQLDPWTPRGSGPKVRKVVAW
jgi:type IV secretory pathway VirB10-like protein